MGVSWVFDEREDVWKVIPPASPELPLVLAMGMSWVFDEHEDVWKVIPPASPALPLALAMGVWWVFNGREDVWKMTPPASPALPLVLAMGVWWVFDEHQAHLRRAFGDLLIRWGPEGAAPAAADWRTRGLSDLTSEFFFLVP